MCVSTSRDRTQRVWVQGSRDGFEFHELMVGLNRKRAWTSLTVAVKTGFLLRVPRTTLSAPRFSTLTSSTSACDSVGLCSIGPAPFSRVSVRTTSFTPRPAATGPSVPVRLAIAVSRSPR